MTIADMALQYAIEKHKGQFRADKVTPFIEHPKAVGGLVRKYKGNSHNIERLVAVAYLHDVLEDTETKYEELVRDFGYDIASMVWELTVNDEIKNAIGKDKYWAYTLKHMSSWALVVKLCDRLNNITDLTSFKEARKKRFAEETLYMMKYLKQNREYLSETQNTLINEIKFNAENILENIEV